MKPNVLLALTASIMLIINGGCVDASLTSLPPVRIVKPTLALTRLYGELETVTPVVVASATQTPRPSATRKPTVTPSVTPEDKPISKSTLIIENLPSKTPAPSGVQSRLTPSKPNSVTARVTATLGAGSTGSNSNWYPCAEGQIKANRNSGIYHLPTGSFYAKTRLNVQCFDTEAQAQAAGFRRAKN